MTIMFEDTTEPVKISRGRPRETTVFDAPVGELAKHPGNGKAKRFRIPEDAYEAVRKDLRSAGRLHGVNVRIHPELIVGKNGNEFEITFAVHPRATRKNSDDANSV